MVKKYISLQRLKNLMVRAEKAPVTSLKRLKTEIERLKKQIQPVDAQLLLRLLDYIESREKLLKELLIHMNAVENHLVKVTELLQKLPQVNVGLLADSLQAMIPKLDEIAYNTRKMVDYLELAVEVEEPKESREHEEKERPVEKKERVSEQLAKIEEQNEALIDALSKLSESLSKMGST